MDTYINEMDVVDKLCLRLIAINYKIAKNMPLTEQDIRHQTYLIQCAELFEKLNNEYVNEQNAKEIINNVEKQEQKLFCDNISPSTCTDIVVVPEEDPISFETDLELIEICKLAESKFNDITNKYHVELKNIQRSFWIK